jgi:phosphotriesterase-related protein
VLGDIPAEQLGIVLPHEHVFVDLRAVWALPGASVELVSIENRHKVARNPTAYPDCLVLNDAELAISELRAFKADGGGAIADVTPDFVGRKPADLAEVSRATGVHVVAGCGPYVERAHDPRLKHMSVDALAEELKGAVLEGLDGTAVRAGIIGEIGTSDPVGPNERKALAAAAVAQQATGCAITVHVHMGARTGHEILSLIEAAGGDLSRVVLGHLDVHLSPDFEPETAVAHHRELADRGCFIEYDLCGFEEFVQLPSGQSYHHATDEARADAIVRLVELGYASRLLLSHDVGKKIQLKRFGGPGYSHAITTFKDLLAARGLPADVVRQIYEANPQSVLSIAA